MRGWWVAPPEFQVGGAQHKKILKPGDSDFVLQRENNNGGMINLFIPVSNSGWVRRKSTS